MRAVTVLAIGAALLLCGTRPALAIYEDQAGQYDWLKQHVGRVTVAQLVTKPRPRLYVASAAGAMAAVVPRDGSLLWRKVLAEGDTVSHLLVAGSTVVTLSDGGKQLRGWDADSGTAVWAAAAASSAELAASAGGADAVLASGGNAVIVAVGGAAKAFGAADGELLWTASLAGGVSKLFAAADGSIWAVSAQPGASQLTVTHLGADGNQQHQATLAAAGMKLSSTQLLVTDKALAALSADGSQLCSAAVPQAGSGSGSLSCQSLSSLLPAGALTAGARLVPGICSSHAALQTAGGAAVLALGGSGGGAAVVKFVPGATASACFLGEAPAGPLVALAAPSTAGLQLQVLSAADGSSVQDSVAPDAAMQRVNGSPVGVAALFATSVQSKKSGGQTFRHLAVMESDTLVLVQGGSTAWVRNEELASVTDVLFTDLPAPTPDNEAAWQASQPSFVEMVRAQVMTLKVQARLAGPEERASVERYKAVTNDKLRPTRDPDGFRKQVVLLTAGGKVLALHNGDGRILWSLDFGPAAAPRKLALWRVPHDVQHDIEVVAFAVGSDSTIATIINAHTGRVQQTLSVPAAAADLLTLPEPLHDGLADQHVYVVVPTAGSGSAAARVLPDTPQAAAAFVAACPALSFWEVDEEAGSVRGMGFTDAGVAEERWSVVLAPAGSGQHILHVAAHSPDEAVASPARVLGSGGLKFKYLNPNTLLVAVGVALGAGGQASEAEQKLTVVLLDAVSGRVLFSQAHEHATGPVHAVLSENVATYHFWNTEAHRWQMAAIELNDASPSTLKVSDLAFGEVNASSSSWDAPPLEAGSQSFLCRLPVAGLAVTRSARGTTAKQVIMLTTAGQVYLLDRRFLDPRRPIIPPGQKPTPEQAAEQLPPYQPELPIVGTSFATLDREVRRLRGVTVQAAVLESTQLMLAHGMDLFYTRLTPSKSFDMVPDDFPYALLVLLVVSLVTATVVLHFMQRRTAVKAKWL